MNEVIKRASIAKSYPASDQSVIVLCELIVALAQEIRALPMINENDEK